MEPLFSAVICGCNAGRFRKALNEVYIPRIQRGNASFAANVLGARGPLLSALVHFFEHGRWGSLVETGIEGESLVAEDQLFILAQAGLYLTGTRGLQSPEARICHERLANLCHSLGRPLLLYSALRGQWRYSLMTDKLTATMQIAKRINSLAQEQNHAALKIGAYGALEVTFYFWVISNPRDNTRQAVLRSGAREAYHLWSKNPSHPPPVVCAIWHYPSGISARSPLVKRP
jgi:hypothetical protein